VFDAVGAQAEGEADAERQAEIPLDEQVLAE
jgi:hypothetical protein